VRKDIALILLILAILALIVVPLGPTMLDVLLSINLTFAVLLLIVAVYLKHPADFPTFPTVILLGTAFRLALSISTTRQILSEADAGDIIKTFGTFVIGGNIAIGLIVFLIITVFQFLVVTKGAERVAEVSARFALDAMPGKQMSMALCAGIVTTRVEGTKNDDLGSDIWRDLVSDPRVPAAAAGIVILIGLIPGFPFINFAIGAAILLLVSFSIRKVLAVQRDQDAADAAAAAAAPMSEQAQIADDMADPMGAAAWTLNDGPRSDRVILRIGGALAASTDLAAIDAQVGAFLDRYDQTRGLCFHPPRIEVIDNSERFARSFEVLLDEVPIITETVPADSYLLRCDDSMLEALGCHYDDAAPVRWHEFGGFWLPDSTRDKARETHSEPVPLETLIATITFRIVETNVGVLFSDEQFNRFLAHLADASPAKRAQLDEQSERTVFFQTLRYLAEDGVPLRPVPLIVDTYLTWIHSHGNVGALELSEFMRGSLKRQICHAMSGARDVIGVVLLDPEIENETRHALAQAGQLDSAASSDGLPLNAELSDALLAQFKSLLRALSPNDPVPVVIASSSIRRRLRNYLSANRVSLPVLAPHELSPEINIHPVARMVMPSPDAAY